MALSPGHRLGLGPYEIVAPIAAARRAGIVHRDLKPANVMLTKSGVKVLDFGLARMATGAGAAGLASGTMTAATPLTGVGMLLGTLPYMSPEQVEGRAVVYMSDRRRGTGDLWLHDLVRGTATRPTNDEWSEGAALWSPDGKTIAYGWDKYGPPDIYTLAVDGGAAPRLVFASPEVDYPVAWLPGDRLLVWGAGQYKVVRLDGSADDTVTTLPNRSSGWVTVSPDGRWMARTSGETGRDEVYVEPFGRPGSRAQVFIGGGKTPVWSRDGRSLYYVSEHTLFEAAIRPGATFACDSPTPVFNANAEIGSYDVAPDGQRFLVLRRPPADFLPFNVIVNWPALIR